MNAQADKVIGIVGGMGPQAGLTLFNRVLCHTGAATDQQHLPVILMSFPGRIADRTAFLEARAGSNPAFAIARIIGSLENAGAQVVGMACNTAHAPPIYDVITAELEKAGSRVKLLHMPRETCRYIGENHPHVRRVGLMATNGTYKAEVYADLLRAGGYEAVIPGYAFQDAVIHRMIYDPHFGVKANPGAVARQVRQLADQALAYFHERGAHAVILGCTELAMVFPERRAGRMLLVDTTETLARALIREATCPCPGPVPHPA
jgi:aspartate racemase